MALVTVSGFARATLLALLLSAGVTLTSTYAAPPQQGYRQADKKPTPKMTSGVTVGEVKYDTVGPVYEILEPDILDEIMAKLRQMEASGDFDRMNRENVEAARRKLDEPDAIAGLRIARARRTWTFDPSITVNRDIVLPDGNLLAKKGDRISPLSMGQWTPWLFIDTRDSGQIATARKWLASHSTPGNPGVVIAVGGSWQKASVALKHGVLFDQAGMYTRKFSIQATPAEVVQDGAVLRITEFPAQ